MESAVCSNMAKADATPSPTTYRVDTYGTLSASAHANKRNLESVSFKSKLPRLATERAEGSAKGGMVAPEKLSEPVASPRNVAKSALWSKTQRFNLGSPLSSKSFDSEQDRLQWTSRLGAPMTSKAQRFDRSQISADVSGNSSSRAGSPLTYATGSSTLSNGTTLKSSTPRFKEPASPTGPLIGPQEYGDAVAKAERV